jgi:outer membrane protein TolC
VALSTHARSRFVVPYRVARFVSLASLSFALWLAPARTAAEAPIAGDTITLAALLGRALAEPPRVLAALASLQRAEAESRSAEAAYYPVLSLQVSEGFAFDNRQQVPNTLLDALGLPQQRGRLDALSLQTAGSATLDLALINVSRRHAIKAAGESREAQEHALAGAQRLALAAACELYIRALSATELVEDAALNLARRSQQHEGVKGLVEAGLRPPVDEMRARIEALAARYRLDVRRVEERAAFAALTVSAGRDPAHPLRPQPLQGVSFAGPRTLSEAIARAFDHRPELVSLQKSLGARQSELSAALYRRLPTLGVSGTASASYIDQLRGNGGYQGSQYSATALAYLRVASVDVALWRSADVARGRMLEAQRALEIAALDLKAEVAEASFAVDRTRAELERATHILSAAESARAAQNGRYQSGVASLLELLDAEAVEQNARLERIQAARDHQLASVRLLSATGLIRNLLR